MNAFIQHIVSLHIAVKCCSCGLLLQWVTDLKYLMNQEKLSVPFSESAAFAFFFSAGKYQIITVHCGNEEERKTYVSLTSTYLSWQGQPSLLPQQSLVLREGRDQCYSEDFHLPASHYKLLEKLLLAAWKCQTGSKHPVTLRLFLKVWTQATYLQTKNLWAGSILSGIRPNWWTQKMMLLLLMDSIFQFLNITVISTGTVYRNTPIIQSWRLNVWKTKFVTLRQLGVIYTVH